MSLLTTHDLVVSFGGVRAVSGVSLEVGEGSLVGLIGPNGAGKTTLIDALTGLVPAQGSIFFNGTDVSGLPAFKRSRLGIARTWQSLEMFEVLSVRDNLRAAAGRPSFRSFARDLATPLRTPPPFGVGYALETLGLEKFADRLPSELSHGQQKLVGIARALAAEPSLICMDEPAAGLDTAESGKLGVALRTIVEQGHSILLVDHDMGLVLGVCDFVVVLEFGAVIATGTPDEVKSHPRVVEAYLGTPRYGSDSTRSTAVGGVASTAKEHSPSPAAYAVKSDRPSLW